MLSPKALEAEEARLRAAVALVAAVEAGPLSPLRDGLVQACAGAILRYAALAPLSATTTVKATYAPRGREQKAG